MIRINLLAEEQAAEAARRRDPVKRATWAAGLIVGLVAAWTLWGQVKVMRSNAELAAVQGRWHGLAKDFGLVSTNLLRTGAIERKLEALDRLSTNRFLWANVLNGLQFAPVPNVEVREVSALQSYEIKPARTNENKTVTPGTSTEKITLTLRAYDLGNENDANHALFIRALGQVPFFEAHLRKPDGIRFVERIKPSLEGLEGRRPAMFTVECQFPDKVR